MSNIALFLDIDGVLNQYVIDSRIRRYKIGYDFTFQPYLKKCIRFNKIVKKFNIDVYIFSAWTQKRLVGYVENMKGDTYKWAENVIEISKNYKHNIIIEDEIHYSNMLFGKDRLVLPKDIKLIKTDWRYGLVLKDFKYLEKYIGNIKRGEKL